MQSDPGKELRPKSGTPNTGPKIGRAPERQPRLAFPQGWAFPVQFTPEHLCVATTAGESNIADSIRVILGTPFGTRRARPQFGSRLAELVTTPKGFNRAGALQREVQRCILANEPRIELEKVQVLQDTSNGFEILLEYRQLDTLTRHNYVYPIFQSSGQPEVLLPTAPAALPVIASPYVPLRAPAFPESDEVQWLSYLLAAAQEEAFYDPEGGTSDNWEVCLLKDPVFLQVALLVTPLEERAHSLAEALQALRAGAEPAAGAGLADAHAILDLVFADLEKWREALRRQEHPEPVFAWLLAEISQRVAPLREQVRAAVAAHLPRTGDSAGLATLLEAVGAQLFAIVGAARKKVRVYGPMPDTNQGSFPDTLLLRVFVRLLLYARSLRRREVFPACTCPGADAPGRWQAVWQTLNEAGVALLVQYACPAWTNFLPSDPGITILECVCGALADLECARPAPEAPFQSLANRMPEIFGVGDGVDETLLSELACAQRRRLAGYLALFDRLLQEHRWRG